MKPYPMSMSCTFPTLQIIRLLRQADQSSTYCLGLLRARRGAKRLVKARANPAGPR
jgi:hypothetical protein